VTWFGREVILDLNSEDASSSPKDYSLDEVNKMNEAIRLTLFDEFFSSVPSVRQIARMICVPKDTIYRRLVDSLHFTIRHQTSDIRHQTSDIRYLYWVPRKLSDSQKSEGKSSRVVDPTSRLLAVHPALNMRWEYILRIYPWQVSHGSICRQIMRWSGCQMEIRDEIPDREKHMIQSPKSMLTFVWNPHGFQTGNGMLKERCSRPLLFQKYSHRDRFVARDW
jgi:hypothetical protein